MTADEDSRTRRDAPAGTNDAAADSADRPGSRHEPGGTGQPVLRVEGLEAAFRVDGAWQTVVRDLAFTIDREETLAIVGESGSGKSVTALSIMRLVSSVSGRVGGRIELAGRNLPDLDERAMQAVRGGEIGMIFQEPMTSLNPVLTVGYQIREVLEHHRGMDGDAARAETLRLFDLVRIADARDRLGEYPHTFSGGMRQRIMIAMALACRPRLLIADEPTTALDVTIQAQILELIRSLQHEIGMAVMFITHDMGVVAEVADRVVVMLKGEKVESGDVRSVFGSPRHGYTRRLLAAVPRLGALSDTDLPRRFPSPEAMAAHGRTPGADSHGDAGRRGDDDGTAHDRDGDTADAMQRRADAAEPDVEPDRRGRVILSVTGLSTRFPIRGGLFGRVRGNVHAVENLDFELREAETLALVGESGCGKSTTGRSILQLVRPSAGTVRFADRDLGSLRGQALRDARRRVQMIFQDPYGSLNPRKTVGASIGEPMRVHDLRRGPAIEAEVRRLLELVGLRPEHALRFPHEFSGGQRQRLCIARCLALEPRVIVADEAVSALDVSIQAQVLNLLLELQRTLGLAYLFISHDIAVVERVSHRIAVMYLGEIVEIGPRRTILESPAHPYTKKLISAAPIPDPDVRRERSGLMTEELESPIRPPDWQAKPRPMVQRGPDHWVRETCA